MLWFVSVDEEVLNNMLLYLSFVPEPNHAISLAIYMHPFQVKNQLDNKPFVRIVKVLTQNKAQLT
jgi:hypothetical protein